MNLLFLVVVNLVGVVGEGGKREPRKREIIKMNKLLWQYLVNHLTRHSVVSHEKHCTSKKRMSAAESENKQRAAVREGKPEKLQVWRKVGLEGDWPRGGSDITLMNQCQQSDEKIIKKQARSVLNTAKGKRYILLYWSTVWMEKMHNKWKQEQKRSGKKIHIINDAKMPFRWHYESRQYK